MELRTLQYFLTVVREGNISRAADMLHITQPALSRQISSLEEEVGTQLIIRGKQLTLTDAGIMLQRRAEEVIYLMEKLESEMQEQNDVGGIISIGIGGQFSVSGLPMMIRDFSERYPKVQFHFYTNNAENIKKQLDRGLLDLGLLLEPIDTSRYGSIYIKEKARWGLLLRKDHPLAQKEFIKKEDLKNLPLITASRSGIQKRLENWLGEDFGQLKVVATYDVVTNVAMLVECGMASALTIESAVNLFAGDRLVFLPLFPELKMSSVLAWNRYNPLFGAAGKFISIVKENIDLQNGEKIGAIDDQDR